MNIVVNKTQTNYFNKFDKAWGYAGKSLLATRHVLNTVLSSCRWIALSCETRQNLREMVLRLKIFSIVSVPLNMTSMPRMFNKIVDNIHWKDSKGTILSTVSATILVADTLDSITTFANTTTQLLSKPGIGWMSNLGLPLAYTIVGVGSIVRLIKMRDLTKFLNDVERGVLSELNSKRHDPEALKDLVSKFVYSNLPSAEISQIALNDLKRHQEAVLERRGNSKVVKLMNSLTEILDSGELTEEKSKEIMMILNDVVQTLKLERKVQCGYLVSNLLTISALSLFMFPGFSALPFSLLAVSMITRISLQVHQDFN